MHLKINTFSGENLGSTFAPSSSSTPYTPSKNSLNNKNEPAKVEQGEGGSPAGESASNRGATASRPDLPSTSNYSAPLGSTVHLKCPIRLQPGLNRATAYPRVSAKSLIECKFDPES